MMYVKEHEPCVWLQGTELFPYIKGAITKRVEGNFVVLYRSGCDGECESKVKALNEFWLGRTRQTAGVRIEFETNAKVVYLMVSTDWVRSGDLKKNWARTKHAFCSGDTCGETKVDVVEEGQVSILKLELGSPPYTFYFATSCITKVHSIGFPLNSVFAPKTTTLTWLAFGDSHTQGGYCTSPALNFPAIVSRELGIDYYNCGIDGYRCDVEVAMLFPVSCDVITILVGTNCYSTEDSTRMEELYEKLFGYFIDKYPETPIIVITPFYRRHIKMGKNKVAPDAESYKFPPHDIDHTDIRKACGTVFAKMKDGRMFFIDGMTMVDDVSLLCDWLHTNDEGMGRIAKVLIPVMRNVLQMSMGGVLI